MRDLNATTAPERRLAVIEIVRPRVRALGVTNEQLATLIGQNQPSRVGRMLDDDASENFPMGALVPIDRRLGGHPLLEEFARALGRRTEPLAAAAAPGDVMEQAARALEEAADAVRRVLHAASGGISPAESRALLPELDQAIDELGALRALIVAANVRRAA